MANGDTIDPGLDPFSQEPVSKRPPPPGKPPTDEELDRSERQQQQQQMQRQIDALERVIGERHDIFAQEQAALAPRRQALEQSLKTSQQTADVATQRYLTSETDIPEYKTPDIRGDVFQWFSAAAALGSVAGALSRYHSTAALNAMGGFMKGVAEGQYKVIEENYQTWKANAERAHELNDRAQREYTAIITNAKLDIDTKSNLLKMTAAKYEDQLTMNAADARDINQLGNIITAQTRLGDNYFKWMTQMQTRHAEFDTKTKASLATKGFKIDENNNIVPDPDNPSAIDDAALNSMVERRLLGDKSVVQNIGRGTQGAANIARFNNRLAEVMARRGIQAADLVQLDQQFAGGQSYQVAAGRYASRVESATNELQRAIPLAERASRNFPRGDWVHWNELVQRYQAGTSDPKYNDFIVKALSARNAYVRAMNPTGNPRIAERLELQADKILDAAIGPDAFSTQLRGMWQEAETSRAAIAETRGLPVPETRPFPETGGPAAGGAGGGGTAGTVIRYDSEGNVVQ